MPGRIQLILPPSEMSQSAAIDGALSLAQTLDARLTLALPQTNADLPTHWLAREYAYADVATFNARSAEEAEALKQEALAAAAAAGVEVQALELVHGVLGGERAVVMAARTHDLSVLGLGDQDGQRRQLAEELLFDSGRPLMIVPLSRPCTLRFETIAVAWDHSEPASRVVASALPVIKRAKRVIVFSVLGAKKLPRLHVAQDAADYLESHGLECVCELVETEDRAPGRFIMETAIARGAGVLVMGAYATLPAQERLFGGVTLSALSEPLLPLIMVN